MKRSGSIQQGKRLLPAVGLSLFVLLFIAAAVVGNTAKGKTVSAPHSGGGRSAQADDSPGEVSLPSFLPTDVEGGLRRANLHLVQRDTDRFSWQEFIALHWPAREGQRGEPDTEKRLGAVGPRVWETWKETHEVYLPDSSEPLEWSAPQALPAGVKEAKSPRQEPPPLHFLSASLQAAQADGTLPPTLTDRRGNLVRYEIRMNRILFEYIRAHKLYDSRQQSFQDSLSFPDGSMLIKAAWREITPEEEARFLTADAWISDLKGDRPVRWRRRKMGLVGFHIMQKTPSSPQWIWSTFEQVDNVSGPHASFHDSRFDDAQANRQTRPGAPNQVTRVAPIPDKEAMSAPSPAAFNDVQALNHAMQQALAGEKSVLQYYELVNTQWPQSAPEERSAPATVFRVQPQILANTTMETFTQDTSTCMGCHAMARSNRADRFVAADFTFTLNNAYPRPPAVSPNLIPPPLKPATDWDRQNWRSIRQGFELAEHTFEKSPGHVGSKLHCSSCHLDAGRNPTSSWWVGMTVKYKYPATDDLYARINQCFERSLNGHAIPAKADASESSPEAPEMHALVTYMQWLDEQYRARNRTAPANGMPPIQKVTGNAEIGAEIYLQKCAFCHGKEGKGRYENRTYYRPAVWGPNSFNDLAGLNVRPDKLASFLKSNMPLGSGGVLTLQESWDLVAYFGKQARPHKDKPATERFKYDNTPP